MVDPALTPEDVVNARGHLVPLVTVLGSREGQKEEEIELMPCLSHGYRV